VTGELNAIKKYALFGAILYAIFFWLTSAALAWGPILATYFSEEPFRSSVIDGCRPSNTKTTLCKIQPDRPSGGSGALANLRTSSPSPC